jgi:hypothetical protein
MQSQDTENCYIPKDKEFLCESVAFHISRSRSSARAVNTVSPGERFSGKLGSDANSPNDG